MITLICQMNRTCGWTLYGLTGERFFFRKLSDAGMLAFKCNAELKIIDKEGYELN